MTLETFVEQFKIHGQLNIDLDVIARRSIFEHTYTNIGNNRRILNVVGNRKVLGMYSNADGTTLIVATYAKER